MLRATLLPAPASAALGRMLAPLFSPALVVAVLSALAGLDALVVVRLSVVASLVGVLANPDKLLIAFVLILAGLLFHELGHAAGCSYGGGRPGRIGVGLYVVMPAFFTNVTDSYRLSRRARLRTDLGGVYFNAIAAVAACAVALATHDDVAVAVALLVQVNALQQLLPFVRLDGYFILTDLLGVPDLFGAVGPLLGAMLRRRPRRDTVAAPARAAVMLKRSTRRLVLAWMAVVLPALVAMLVVLLVELPTFAQTTWHEVVAEVARVRSDAPAGRIADLVLSTLSLALLVLPYLGLAMLAARSAVVGAARLAALAGRSEHSRRPRRRLVSPTPDKELL